MPVLRPCPRCGDPLPPKAKGGGGGALAKDPTPPHGGKGWCSCPPRKTGRGSTRAWRTTRARILDRDQHRCQVLNKYGRPCGNTATTVDHIIPVARGGTDDPENLRAACRACNARKGARLDPRR